MGHCLVHDLEFLMAGRAIKLDSQFKSEIDNLKRMAEKQSLTKSELKHVEAVVNLSKKDFTSATACFEEILLESPTDIHALKMAHDMYFFAAQFAGMMDSIARVVPFWESSNLPMKSYVHGLYAFALEENNFYAKAEAEAKKALQMNANDAWATHAMAHVFEMEGRADDGINFLDKTSSDWKVGEFLASHNFWHWALYLIEKGDYDSANDIFTSEIFRRTMDAKSILNIIDATSLLYRLELTEIVKRDNRDYWDHLYAVCKPHLKEHNNVFIACHLLIALLGKKNFSEANELLDSLAQSEEIFLGKNIVRPLFNAMIQFEREQYATAVNLLLPLKYKLVEIGGSYAQRDLFNQLLIIAAIKSTDGAHRTLAHRLIIERQALKPSPLGDRILSLENKEVIA
ncbi:tetratricopeptide repeat protein 38-like protein [Dinothrombium tinctorium]|uniref:Tetratricopeptide repeat protein 38 n=2 Tax=Dinothrombium tinctorium TaxID=1965070 RepID=A0A443RIB4_9ACAR|nr:tetratricopeptide repeat protein 38-like protein [Dinothrombium tinctorium]